MGSVGPFAAPYEECTIWTPVGHLVTFMADSPNTHGGLVFTDRPSTAFQDERVRHLVGNWWMFAPSTDANGDPGSCSFGYRFADGS